MKNKNKNNISSKWMVATLIVMGIGLLGYNRFFDPVTRDARQVADIAGVECLPQGHTNLAQHIHANISIIVRGETITIPANIGIVSSCMSEIHTHDNSGGLHIESVFAEKTFTLGQFFDVWKEDFSREKILKYITDDTNDIVMTVNGIESQEFENLALEDEQNIVIEYLSKE